MFGGLGIVLIALLFWLALQWMPKPVTPPDQPPTQTNESGQSSQSQSSTNSDSNTSPGGESAVSNETMSAEAIDQITQAITETIYFKPDAYELDESYYEVLQNIVDTATRFKEVSIVVEGHYNSKPGDVVTSFRESLAQNRADVVVAYLVSQGIDPSRVETVNMGAKQPVNKDDSWQEIEKNRRVVVRFKALKP